jgi:hypothetical protein
VPVQPTSNAREKAEGAKAYIERKYAKLKSEEKEKKEGEYIIKLLLLVSFLRFLY